MNWYEETMEDMKKQESTNAFEEGRLDINIAGRHEFDIDVTTRQKEVYDTIDKDGKPKKLTYIRYELVDHPTARFVKFTSFMYSEFLKACKNVVTDKSEVLGVVLDVRKAAKISYTFMVVNKQRRGYAYGKQ